MLQNAYLLAKIGADTAENERNFAEFLPKIGNSPKGSCPARRPPAGRARPAPPRGGSPLNRARGGCFPRVGFGSVEADFAIKGVIWKRLASFEIPDFCDRVHCDSV